MIEITAIVALVQSVLYDVVLFYVEKILSDARQLRNYLGLNSEKDSEDNYYKTIFWLELIGKLLKIIAIVSICISTLTTFSVLSF